MLQLKQARVQAFKALESYAFDSNALVNIFDEVR